jgi:lipopolysaccharide export system protein LptA
MVRTSPEFPTPCSIPWPGLCKLGPLVFEPSLQALILIQAERIRRVVAPVQTLASRWWPGLILTLCPLTSLAVPAPVLEPAPALREAGSDPPGAWPLPSAAAAPEATNEAIPRPAASPVTAPGEASPTGGLAAGPAQTALTGLVTIESDLQKADNNTGVITATGNVRIVYRDRGVVATSRQAQYFSREGRVVLSGDVEVVQEGGNRLQADRVVYLVESERLVAQPLPGQQVTSRVRIPPPKPAPPPVSPQLPGVVPTAPAQGGALP